MYDTELSFYSSLFLTVVCFLSGSIWLMIWSRNRHAIYMIPTALSWYAFSIYFAMLAISAGHKPLIERDAIINSVRGWGFVVGILILSGKVILLRMWARGGGKENP